MMRKVEPRRHEDTKLTARAPSVQVEALSPSSPRKRGPRAGDARWPWAPAFAGATKSIDFKRSPSRGPAVRQSHSSCLRVFVVQALVILFVVLGGPVLAVLPSERLGDPALEARARGPGHGTRCLHCQTHALDGCSAHVAHRL